jgi:hypothetical protein
MLCDAVPVLCDAVPMLCDAVTVLCDAVSMLCKAIMTLHEAVREQGIYVVVLASLILAFPCSVLLLLRLDHLL